MPRAFTAIDIPEDIAEKLAKTQEKIGVGKPVNPEKMHITLEFFEGLEEKQVRETKDNLEKIDLEPFKIEINGLGVFPSKKHIRVIWAGVDSKNIQNAYRKTREVTPDSDNNHDFLPHATISRVKDLRRGDKKKIHRALEQNSETSFGSFTASKIKLYESRFGKKGSVYRELYVKNCG